LKELKARRLKFRRREGRKGCSPMRTILIAAAMTALLLVAAPVALAGHGGGELLRAESSAKR